MEAKGINIVATIILMAMVITANSQHAYSDCFNNCSPACFSPTVDHKCLVNCDLKCHGSATQQFLQHCKNSCLQVYCGRFHQDGIKKHICDTSCSTFCHVN